MGILYFIQPAELVGTTRFKVGCSTKNDLSRVKSYKSGTRMIMILQCEDPFLLEAKVLIEFNNQFHKIAGNEYFEGDESMMRKVFYDTYLQWEHHKKDGIAKWRNDKLKEQQQRLAQLQKDLEVLRLEIVQGEAYLERVMRGEEDESILAQHTAIPLAACAQNTEKTVKHRPSSLTECFKRDTLLHHNKCGVNAYAMVCAEDGLVYACDERMNRTGAVFKSLNAFTKSNYVEKNKKEGTQRSTQTNAYAELQYKNDEGRWMTCDAVVSGTILTTELTGSKQSYQERKTCELAWYKNDKDVWVTRDTGTGEREKRERAIITRPPLEDLIKSETHFRFTHKGTVAKCFTTNGTCFIDESDQCRYKSLASWTVAVIEKGGGGGRKVSAYEVCEVLIGHQWRKWGDVYTPDCTFIQ
jgi:hypothetical protein